MPVETPVAPKITSKSESQPAKESEQQASFLAKVRHGIASEIGLTFTLPDPRDGIRHTFNDLLLKGAGLSGIVIGSFFGEQAHEGKIYRMPGDTAQHIHNIERDFEISGGIIAGIGAVGILMANRIRSQRRKDEAAFQERLHAKRTK